MPLSMQFSSNVILQLRLSVCPYIRRLPPVAIVSAGM